MPYFHLAGETNNPIIQGPKYGYKTIVKFKSESSQTLQEGEISISELSDR